MSTLKALASAAIERESEALRKISLEIWNNPELCFEERRAHKVLTDYLDKQGFSVERSYKLETAFRATFASQGVTDESPNIGVLCEYDALPGIGHGCGHNLIAITGLAVAVAVKDVLARADVKGKVTVLGTPAEEGGGGKIDLINLGAFKDIDIAMMAHPMNSNIPKPMTIAVCFIRASFQGKESHASAFPWEGVNALDAAVSAYQNISSLRQQFKPTWKVHGIIEKGGVKPNIIPDFTQLLYYARAPSSAELKLLEKKIRACFEGAAAATGCTLSYNVDPKFYDSMVSNEKLSSFYINNAQELGIEFEDEAILVSQPRGSTDMGNVSKVVPSIHPMFNIITPVAAHTREFRDAAGTEVAHKQTLLHSQALAMAAIDVYRNPEVVKQMQNDFQEQLQNES